MHTAFLAWSWRAVVGCALILGGGWMAAETMRADEVLNRQPLPEVTNVMQISRLVLQNSNAGYDLHLTGDIWWANPAQGEFVLKDESGAAELEMDLQGQSIQPGQRVQVEGNAT